MIDLCKKIDINSLFCATPPAEVWADLYTALDSFK